MLETSILWHPIEDEYATTLTGGGSKFNHTLITEVTFPKLYSSDLKQLSGVNQEPLQHRIIYLNNGSGGGLSI